jgi:hypothetical protein
MKRRAGPPVPTGHSLAAGDVWSERAPVPEAKRAAPRFAGLPFFLPLRGSARLGEASVVAQLNAAEGQAQRPNINFLFFSSSDE